MSGIVRYPESVPAGTGALECVRCKKQYPISKIEELGDPLTCIACDGIGLVPRQRDRIADKYPGKLGERFVAIPHALFDPDNSFDLTPAERLVIIALETFRWRWDDVVYPSQERIASMTGLSRRTVQRTLDALAADNLITVWRERHSNYAHNEYDLNPLWIGLAEGARRPLVSPYAS